LDIPWKITSPPALGPISKAWSVPATGSPWSCDSTEVTVAVTETAPFVFPETWFPLFCVNTVSLADTEATISPQGVIAVTARVVSVAVSETVSTISRDPRSVVFVWRLFLTLNQWFSKQTMITYHFLALNCFTIFFGPNKDHSVTQRRFATMSRHYILSHRIQSYILSSTSICLMRSSEFLRFSMKKAVGVCENCAVSNLAIVQKL
jgi:hypothetical protein